ncbi:MAG TPA: DUF1501 domain-containing protein [Gemmataceae bacterium]|nr:DUF1501 domain-containing protein [Gemmataceae bacterium]
MHTCLSQTRRDFLRNVYCGFGSLAFAALTHDEQLRAHQPANPLAPQPPHLPNPKAKSVIFLFMSGGPSHLETFDPKPLLNQLHGQTRPAEFGEARYQFVQPDARLLGTRRSFRQYGRSGIEVSDLFPHMAQHIDDIAVIRSCYGDMVVHSAAQYELFSGRIVPGYPSMGSWVLYGLGTESQSLPGYIVMPDPDGAQEAGQPLYGNGFLPALYQPTMFRGGSRPVRNLDLPDGVTLEERRRTMQLIRDLNDAGGNADNPEFAARMNAYETAFRMQTEAPELFDLAGEPRETLDLYGVGAQPTDDYGRRCLLARRLVERGVRFQVVVSGGGTGNLQWDAHQDIEENHNRMAPKVDKPIAGLIKDLKRRGLLDSTLLLWGGEFGRSPEAEGRAAGGVGRGRDHHNLGFTMWMAGGGIKGGQVVGATDDIGLHAIQNRCHFRDIHTTILHQLGLGQDQLNYPHLGRRERLTLVHGRVIEQIV